jgi:hypothetical protein
MGPSEGTGDNSIVLTVYCTNEIFGCTEVGWSWATYDCGCPDGLVVTKPCSRDGCGGKPCAAECGESLPPTPEPTPYPTPKPTPSPTPKPTPYPTPVFQCSFTDNYADYFSQSTGSTGCGPLYGQVILWVDLYDNKDQDE